MTTHSGQCHFHVKTEEGVPPSPTVWRCQNFQRSPSPIHTPSRASLLSEKLTIAADLVQGRADAGAALRLGVVVPDAPQTSVHLCSALGQVPGELSSPSPGCRSRSSPARSSLDGSAPLALAGGARKTLRREQALNVPSKPWVAGWLAEGWGIRGQVLHAHVVGEVVQVPRAEGSAVQDEQRFERGRVRGAVPLHRGRRSPRAAPGRSSW